MTQRKFKFDYRNCLGCCACVIACKQKNEAKKGEGLRKVKIINEGRGKMLPSYYISLSCNHCNNPKCMEVCEEDAIYKTEIGIVCLNMQKCNKCRKCIAACPYGAIKYSEAIDGIIKCNMCMDNENETEPFCVKVCPMGALTIAEVDMDTEGDVASLIFEEMSEKASGGEDADKY